MSLINLNFSLSWPVLSPGPGRNRSLRLAGLVVASVVATVGAFLFESPYYRPLHTGAGEWQTKPLPDGSIVQLGPRTWGYIEFTASKRRIHIFKGEALFEVIKETARPFFVTTAVGKARAVGTKFGVDRRPDRTKFVVAEGLVSVSTPSLNDEEVIESVDVTAGELVVIDGESPPTAIVGDIKAELAWADHLLVMRELPVAEAVSEFNRRSLVQIRLPNRIDLVQCKRFSGTLRATNHEAFADLLSANCTLQLLKTKGNKATPAR